MGLSSASHSKRNAVYGLPTIWGAMMFALVGCALWFSIFSQSPVDRWIAFLMIILILLHLAESNNPFRSLEFTFLPFAPPFANETSEVTIEVFNPTEFTSDALHFRFRGQRDWSTLQELPAQSHRRVVLQLKALSKGRNILPSLIVKTRPTTQLFQLWKVLKAQIEILVLPPAVDHSIEFSNFITRGEESELSHIESITDDRLMYKMDHKLFLKTGKAYYRKSEAKTPESAIFLDWSKLDRLSSNYREEQFSAWIKNLNSKSLSERQLSRANPNPSSIPTSIHISAPFAEINSPAAQLNWPSIKEKYAEWLNAKS